ncbi:hypothetical protein COL922a_014672, partial [Colletotrichum nupharicola]
DDLVIIQLALSKEQIDAVIERSREIKRQAEGTVHLSHSYKSTISRPSDIETQKSGASRDGDLYPKSKGE